MNNTFSLSIPLSIDIIAVSDDELNIRMKSITRNSRPGEIIAQQGDYYLVHLGNNRGCVVMPNEEKKLSPEINIQSIIARGYWEPYTGDTEETAMVLGYMELPWM